METGCRRSADIPRRSVHPRVARIRGWRKELREKRYGGGSDEKNCFTVVIPGRLRRRIAALHQRSRARGERRIGPSRR